MFLSNNSEQLFASVQKWHLFKHLFATSWQFVVVILNYWNHHFILSRMVLLYIKVMIVLLNTCNFNHHRYTCKANILLLLLSSLVTHKIFAIQS